ncbi:hypothetical protein OH77DRAFT_1416741 [Trametes cingulata]|nr:hypothetical protein OH77DRAFT_1416741 [Trametes cingulata]
MSAAASSHQIVLGIDGYRQRVPELWQRKRTHGMWQQEIQQSLVCSVMSDNLRRTTGQNRSEQVNGGSCQEHSADFPV